MAEEKDEFADAFAALSAPAPADAAGETPPAEDPPKATETAPVEVKATDATPPAEDPPKETPPADDPPAEPASLDPNAQLLADMAALREELAAVKATKEAPAAKEAPETPPAPAPVYTEAEKGVVEKYQADWPDVAAGEALLRRAEYQQLVAYVFDQVKKTYDPLLEFASTSSSESQYAKIVAKVPDYDDVRDKALAWADTQPPYLKAAYTQVANEGSAADVIDLINRFKKETGHVTAAVTPPAAAATPPVKPAAALPEPAKRAAASLKVVNSTRSEQTQGVDPNDFEGAFAEFAKGSK